MKTQIILFIVTLAMLGAVIAIMLFGKQKVVLNGGLEGTVSMFPRKKTTASDLDPDVLEPAA